MVLGASVPVIIMQTSNQTNKKKTKQKSDSLNLEFGHSASDNIQHVLKVYLHSFPPLHYATKNNRNCIKSFSPAHSDGYLCRWINAECNYAHLFSAVKKTSLLNVRSKDRKQNPQPAGMKGLVFEGVGVLVRVQLL